MARSERVSIPKDTVTQLTNANVSGNITFQHRSGGETVLIGTTGTTPPTIADFDNGLSYTFREGERGVLLDDIFPGASFVRLWAYSRQSADFIVYHA